jgi:hypothetical protein
LSSRWPAHLRTQRAPAHPHPDRLDRPSWVAEKELIPDSEVTVGEINLRPLAKSIKALTKFSNEMAPGQLSTGVPPTWAVVQSGRAAWEGKNFKLLGLVVMYLDSLELHTRGCGICNHGLAPADALPGDRKDGAQKVGF